MLKVSVLLVSILALFQVTGCDGGSGSSAGSSTVVTKKIFVVSRDLVGDLKTEGAGANGVDGADKVCQADAQATSGTYKALLVDGVNRIACTTANCSGGVSEHTDWVLKPTTKYVRTEDGVTIGTTNSKGLFDFDLDNEISGTNSSELWTGIATDWRVHADTCSRFEDDDTMNNARLGYTYDKTVSAISKRTFSCNYYGITIACVEQ